MLGKVMTTLEFKKLLAGLANIHANAGNLELADALAELAKIFDDKRALKLDTLIDEIRRLKRIKAA